MDDLTIKDGDTYLELSDLSGPSNTCVYVQVGNYDERAHFSLSVEQGREVVEWLQGFIGNEKPRDMLLYCPNCHEQHIDKEKPDQIGEDGKPWMNPPHRSHRCDHCSWIWRPADFPTNGVEKIESRGALDRDARPQLKREANANHS